MPKIYGQWAGNPKGYEKDPERCIKEVYPQIRGWIPHQCRRDRGYGLDKLWCKQHAKKQEAK